ncbi:cell division protein FtsA [Desulfocicer vacuolatum DSM 3385]|uniref:Cell division protein FtsA n=1 Tax=Desulfocicer vacuolatum DSM 3385 TaxID=1121400 RepID=A0A1W1YIR0_9BACT|nr:cell division protein FtsA [Desulfocicer vacuolatum]SMC35638.1 cell division protein FtsA [Desulfocicer vacuolatum DSM 3385]
MQEKEKIIVGLDIGTTKVCAVVGEVVGRDINIIGMGKSPSSGMRKGAVVNIESTVEAIRHAVDEAAIMAECDISSVYVGIAGGHIKGFNSHGFTAIKAEEITPEDEARVIEAASGSAAKPGRETIHIIPQEFIVDEQEAIQNPRGMTGVRLETKIHIVTGAVSSVGNIIKCCNKAGLAVSDIVLESMASGEAVLSPEEKELGCTLVDLGGGTTNLAIFKGNKVKYTFELPLGGETVTNDISIGLRAPSNEADYIKLTHGTCLREKIKQGENIDVPGMGGRESKQFSRDILVDIIEPRVDEMATILKDAIHSNGLENAFPSGIVLTGGTALLNGIEEVIESVFNVPVRVGTPSNIGGLKEVVNNPVFATGVGLVIYGSRISHNKERGPGSKTGISKFMTRIVQWFRDII